VIVGRPHRVTRRLLGLSILLVVLALVPGGVTGAPARFDGVTLQISANYPEYAYAIRKSADEIAQQYGIQLQFDTVTDPQAYPRDMLEFSGGRSSHDLVLFLSSALADYSRYLEPVLPLAKANDVTLSLGDDVLPVYRTYYTWDNVVLGIPFDCGGRFLAYNVAAFRRAENRTAFKAKFGYDLAPPETWDQYRDMAQFFATSDWDGRGGTKLGAVEVWRRGLWAWVWWLDRFASYGGVYFDDQMRPLINAPAGLKAISNMLAVRDYLPRDVATSTNPAMRAGFIRGDAPMFTTWGSTVELSQVPSVSRIVGNVGLTLVPGVKDGSKVYHRPVFGSGYGLGIPKFSAHKDAAIRVLALIGDTKHHTAMTEDPMSLMKPCRLSSLEDPGYARKWARYPGYAKRYIDLSFQLAKIGLPDLQIPSAFEYITAADLQIQLAVTGQKTPKQALDDATAEWNKITDRLGRPGQQRYWAAQNAALVKLGIRYRPELATGP
jgi:multiple sugar transport system substrate-binding protein